jgi:hypothetical protein
VNRGELEQLVSLAAKQGENSCCIGAA